MKKLSSKQKILMGCVSMILAIIGDYLLGFGTFNVSTAPDAYRGIQWNVIADWRLAVSSILGFVCAPVFYVAVVEVLKVMTEKYNLGESILFKLFKYANWAGVFYFAFIHICICMLVVVFNAGMGVTGDVVSSVDMMIRVLKSIAIPLLAGYIICDLGVTVAWIGMVLKGMIPVKKILLICNPLIIAILGNFANYLADGLDSGFESLGWLLMYLVCAVFLTKDNGERKN
ncbi:DUF6796 family protein [Pseudobutyrivibrio sp.]|uniref:DUF6796 family protein n=1 Tax=Pseudobutyrivibrio sp. TaxID=2014367 RepID=UPI0025D35DFA|nr:DUF6796 family protein [Pseudobutyrivibrio sp.]MBR5650414.1 hypothetical protein [Pseudobutyrivibrio sp.]